MTKINKMVMNGFKSFAKHTELVFGDDFNCVIGPNGSGKSNILDALCFVLGRMSAKSMRAEKSANLIYNGGKTRNSAKQGEVSLYFDNQDKEFPLEEEEVKITRIIKKSGQSVYLINDDKSTRQQILDLMSTARIDANGFNIVLQGDIVRFTEMPLDHRREIIEEISGISVYEEKKHKALRELDKVEERLKEASIVLTERNAYLKELKKERDQALKFRELQSQIKENKASYLYIQIERNEKEKEKYDSQIAEHQGKLDSMNNEIQEIKNEIEEKKKNIEDLNKDIEEKGDKGQAQIQRDIEEAKVQLATKKTRKDNIRAEIEKIQIRRKQLEDDLSEADSKIQELRKKKEELTGERVGKAEELEKLEKQVSGFRGDNSINDAAQIEQKIEEIEKESEDKQKGVEKLREKQQELIRNKDSLDFQMNNVDEQIQKMKAVEKEHQSKIDDLKKKKEEFKSSVEELNKRLEEDSIIAKQIGSKKEELSSKEEELAKLRSRSLQLKEHSRGNIAIKNLLEQNKKGVYGTLRDLGSVKQEFSSALETAAGPRINSVVVEDDAVASECIKYLKENKLGSATFLPLNKIRPRDSSKVDGFTSEKGVKGIAIDLINFDSKYEKAFSYVFGDTLVVDDIDSARSIGVGKARMVTLSGDLTETSGAMHGGYRQRKSLGFNEEEVVSGLKKCEDSLKELNDSISMLVKRRAENEEKIDLLRKSKADLEGDIIKTEKSLHLEDGDVDASQKKKDEFRSKLDQVEKELGSLQEEIKSNMDSLMELKRKKQELRDSLNKVRNPEALAELNAFEQKRDEVKEAVMNLDGKINNLNTEIKEMRLPEKERFSELLKGLDKDEKNFKEELTKLSSEIDGKEKELVEKEENARQFYAQYKGLFAQRSKIEDFIGENERKIDKLRDTAKDEEIKLNQVSLVNAEVKAKLAGLREEFSQYEGVKVDTSRKLDDLKRDISKFERMADDIGSVNLRALDIYEEVEKEYSSLLGKKDKLSTEKEDVLQMMEEIDTKKKDLFMKAYHSVNAKFQEFFRSLSTKGEAFLELENEEKPFEGGIDIKVRIVGKKFMDIRSLSGGEKTMTALAFIFAIQEYEPHKFYILDEIDAALDKKNAEKLANLIRTYVDKAQYIVISHNDAVITEADNLYGISMNEHSISNVTTLKV